MFLRGGPPPLHVPTTHCPLTTTRALRGKKEMPTKLGLGLHVNAKNRLRDFPLHS